ncbi:uncharacterized protein [Drosophila bipectinata]|uniref:uncharacterized protein n=1 Tax=Drosophila bipectinata TaxID=42026 RepID=UPI001C8A02B7|nr:uncharacterized protein LOC108132607 [Drosophila bipectinata]
MSSADSTLYYTAFDDMFKELLAIEGEPMDVAERREESGLETPKRYVEMRKQKLFAKDSGNFVLSRRSPKLETKFDMEVDLTPSRRRELLGDEILRLRKDRSEKDRLKPQRRLTLRI